MAENYTTQNAVKERAQRDYSGQVEATRNMIVAEYGNTNSGAVETYTDLAELITLLAVECGARYNKTTLPTKFTFVFDVALAPVTVSAQYAQGDSVTEAVTKTLVGIIGGALVSAALVTAGSGVAVGIGTVAVGYIVKEALEAFIEYNWDEYFGPRIDLYSAQDGLPSLLVQGNIEDALRVDWTNSNLDQLESWEISSTKETYKIIKTNDGGNDYFTYVLGGTTENLLSFMTNNEIRFSKKLQQA